MQCQETQFKRFPVGVAAPHPLRAGKLGTLWVLPGAPDARASPGLAPCAALATQGRCAEGGPSPMHGGLTLLCCSCSALSSSSNSLPRGRGPTARWGRPARWSAGIFFHQGQAAERAASEPWVEEADKMSLSLPLRGDPGESSPSRTSKKHTPFHIWRSKKKQQSLPSDCGVFVPHPPRAPLGEARALDGVVAGDLVVGEQQGLTLRSGEPQSLHTASEAPGPLPAESGLFKKSRAQSSEENKRKPVLGKLGHLFTAGRRRNSRTGLESPTNANAKSASPKGATSSQLPETQDERRKSQGSEPNQTDQCEGHPCQDKPQEPEGEHSETCVQVALPDAELSPCWSSQAAAAVQQCHESDSPQLEPLDSEGEPFPGAAAAAKQLHSSLENSPGQENADTLAGSPQEDAASRAARDQETGAGEVPGSPTWEQPSRGLGEAADGVERVGAEGGSLEPADAGSQPPEDAPSPTGNPPAEGAEHRAGSDQANGTVGPGGRECRPGERAHPAKVLTLDIYLSKTEVAQADEPVVISPGAEDWDDLDDMDKRMSGRRSGRRRKSQKSPDSPGADTAAPDGAARDDAVFHDEVAPHAAAENVSAEKKVKSPREAADGGVASAASPESKSSPGSKGQPRAEPDRSKQPGPATSPTKRRGKSRFPEAAAVPPAGSPRAPAKESPPRRAPAPDSGLAAQFAGENGEEAPLVIPRELTVKSSSLLPELKSEHKRGPLPNHFDGRGEGSRSKELVRSFGGPDANGLKLRNHFGAGRSTVTTKVTLPAKPKHVELNLKTPKSLDSLGNEHNSFNQPVHKGNTATKVSLFENKRANSIPRHTDSRGTRNNTLASSKTFVGRAKLNLAKKAKEMEQPEKKVMPNSHQNTSADTKVVLPEEEVLPVTGSPGGRGVEGEPTEDHAHGFQLKQGDQADGQVDAGCPSEPVATALISGKDHCLLGEDDSVAADNKRPVLENITGTAQDIPAVLDTRDSPKATPKPQDKICDSRPPPESSNGPRLLPVPLPVDIPKDACAQASISNFACTDLKGSENHSGCILPVSHSDNEKMPPSQLGGREASPPLSTEHSPEVMGTETPSKVLVQPVTEGTPPCASDKEPPNLPPNNVLKVFNFNSSNTSHSDLESPSYTEKYLQKEETKKGLDSRSNLHLPETKFSEFSKLKNSDDTEKANHVESVLKSNLLNYGNSDADFMGLFKSSWFDPSMSFSGMSLSDTTTLRGSVQNKINPRPGKVVIYSEPDVSEECIEVFSDTEDCSSWSLSPVILIKVVRGCWILYERPNFEGHSIPLEEGELELAGLWDIPDNLEKKEEEESAKPVVIGSIRHVVQDYRVSHIDLFTEPEGLGVQNSYFDDTEEMQGFGIMQKTCSMKVHRGIWLIYEEPGFQGVPFILEPGEYPDLSFWNTEVAYIGSMRPLKMGGRKVEFPTDPKVVIYEKPFFEGKCVELETEMCSFIMEGSETEETAGEERLPLASVGSVKVLRGIWVAYEKPGFTGHQYLLEEGEYKDWKGWGGYNGELQSLRPILGDFSNAHMIMYSEKNFGSKGSSIDVLGIVANLKETGYGVKTQSINVLSGVWVAYENPDFTGEQYILDKGFYTTFEDWGGKNSKISSVQPICLDSFIGPRRQNQIHLFSEPQFQGQSQSFEETTSQIDDSFSTKSCRVLGGSWVAYDGENFSGNQYVLEEGQYPCLSAMGCLPGTSVKSLRFIDVEFSEPTIILFEREDFKGKKIELNTETVNLRSLGFNTQIRSVQVNGGIWVTYEYGNYRGRQFLLSPAEVPNWYEFSGCRQIGSLRPFNQKRIYFRLRNKATGLFMSTNGNLEDLKLLRIQVMEDVGADDQIWIYQEGCIKCRIAEDCCLTIVGSLVTSGSKLGLALDQNADSQFWSMKSDGRIYSKLKPNLVLDIKGGAQYDQNHIILNTASKERLTQVWEAMVL
ncbi:beta/gamma crystallin domain-containing protein 1 isoform X4 [Saccopteryx bilineata]|uniref:beta/gamma crystallin domain-containing protein 1 isoform X4 n=1 Tax=Saccopteryx bilineata TaxID=59482 RepID=UPI00338E8D1F